MAEMGRLDSDEMNLCDTRRAAMLLKMEDIREYASENMLPSEHMALCPY